MKVITLRIIRTIFPIYLAFELKKVILRYNLLRVACVRGKLLHKNETKTIINDYYWFQSQNIQIILLFYLVYTIFEVGILMYFGINTSILKFLRLFQSQYVPTSCNSVRQFLGKTPRLNRREWMCNANTKDPSYTISFINSALMVQLYLNGTRIEWFPTRYLFLYSMLIP